LEVNLMPRYFFHIVGSNGMIDRDLDGYEVPDLQAVRQEARKIASELAFDALADGTTAHEIIEVVDESGQLVLRLACAGFGEVPV
jgi:hypothetical protein